MILGVPMLHHKSHIVRKEVIISMSPEINGAISDIFKIGWSAILQEEWTLESF